jgi:hypothetical protein
LAVALSLLIIIFHLFLNELVEVDKIGSVLLVGLAVLIRAGSWLDDRTQDVVLASAAKSSHQDELA